ncbi:hypothetical protein BZG36_00701 [Bifiguratus adelaidae]|uniref:Uncharacterized protein n=1 Tax=Bifiguratus adelaidae TaxID=1938954 RepID=A0A261Y6T9_9FUNG|nr:hypothetical protein BZG36_00701 [Bifiguratus adelaidae]
MSLFGGLSKLFGSSTDFSFELGLENEDLLTHKGSSKEQLFLGEYTGDQLLKAMRKSGIEETLAERGYSDMIVFVDTSDHFVHRLTVSDRSILTKNLAETADKAEVVVSTGAGEQNTGGVSSIRYGPHSPLKDQYLIDSFFRRKPCKIYDFKTYQMLRRLDSRLRQTPSTESLPPSPSPSPTPAHASFTTPLPLYNYLRGPHTVKELLDQLTNSLPDTYTLTIIEWLCMQDPKRSFKEDRPRLPGQNWPGLRVGRQMSSLLIDLAIEHGRDALCNVPEHWNNAYLYNLRGYRFLNPAFQGFFESIVDELKADLDNYGLAAVSWAFKNGHVYDSEGSMINWSPEDQIYPTSKTLRHYIASRSYRDMYNAFRQLSYGVRVDWDAAREGIAREIALTHESSEEESAVVLQAEEAAQEERNQGRRAIDIEVREFEGESSERVNRNVPVGEQDTGQNGAATSGESCSTTPQFQSPWLYQHHPWDWSKRDDIMNEIHRRHLDQAPPSSPNIEEQEKASPSLRPSDW